MSCLCQVSNLLASVLGDLQTWVEGEPVKGKSAKPAKPSRAAALQLLQQLASQHCRRACTSENTTDAAVPGNTAAPPCIPDAGAAVRYLSLDSQPEMDIADDCQLVQPQLPPAVDLVNGETESGSEAEISNGIESDSEADINLRGGVASDEEDDKQGPGALAGPLTASAEGQGDQALPAESSHAAAADSEADLSLQSTLAPDCAPASVPTGVAGKLPHHVSLSKVIQQQRRRMSRSQRRASSHPHVALALTEAQQQQWQQEGSQPCNTGMAPITAAMHDSSSMSGQTKTAVSTAQPASGQGRPCAELGVHCTGELVLSKEDEEDDAAPSGRGQDEHQLWQNLAEVLQDKQSSQKLAQLTVTLLGCM